MTKNNGIFGWYFRTNLLFRILIGLVLGGIVGILFNGSGVFAGQSALAIKILAPFGDLFIRLLKMIVQPVIIFTLVAGTASIKPSELGRVGVKIILFYLCTSLFAIVIGLICGNVLSPGVGVQLGDIAAANAQSRPMPDVIQTLLAIIPTNPFDSFAKGDVLPTICFSIFFGIGVSFCREHSKEMVKKSAVAVYMFFNGAAEVIFKVVGWIMQYAPIGVFALIFLVFAKLGFKAFMPLVGVTVSVYIGLILQLVIVYCGLMFLSKMGAVRFIKKARLPMLTAFVTRSSGGTLPVSTEVAEVEMGVSKGVCGFTLPLGATINMDGTTIYLGVCAIFIANAVGMPLSMEQQLMVVITAVLASIGTAGVPGAGAIMLIMVLDSVGLKVEPGTAVAAAYAMILGIDAILDMGRTSMNVTGDLAGTVFVAKLEKSIDMKVWEK